MEAEGYTFDYGLSGEAYGLRPKNVALNELEGYEEFAKGGSIPKRYSEIPPTEHVIN